MPRVQKPIELATLPPDDEINPAADCGNDAHQRVNSDPVELACLMSVTTSRPTPARSATSTCRQRFLMRSARQTVPGRTPSTGAAPFLLFIRHPIGTFGVPP